MRHALLSLAFGLLLSPDPASSAVSTASLNSSAAAKDKYILFHIPFSAGRTIHAELKDVRHNTMKWCGMPSEYGTLEPGCFHRPEKFIDGHMGLADLQKAYGTDARTARKLLVFMRDPVERCASWLVNMAMPACDFNQMSETCMTNCNDRAMWQLGGEQAFSQRKGSPEQAFEKAKKTLEAAYFVGFTEDFTHDFSALLSKIGEKPSASYMRLNTRYKTGRTMPAEGTVALQNLHQKVRDLNKWDLKLYAWARERFHP
jgi:hypothetical protein